MKPLRSHLAVIAVTASLLGVTACGSDNDPSADNISTTTVERTADESSSTTAAPKDTTTSAPAGDGTTSTTAATTVPAEVSALLPYEEYATLQSTITNLYELTPIVETDNPGTRVILFENADGRRVFKSVFVKQNRRLKVINLDGGPPLYDAAI